jgi:hypothetical protein
MLVNPPDKFIGRQKMKRCGMKKIWAVLFLMMICGGAFAQSASGPRGVEASFTFTRQGGFGSNQFAVWIADADGNYVKTLYSTRFTASGGYAKRPQSIPEWVKRSGLAGMGKAQADALTGATPRTGKQSYRWDGTGQSGTAVPPGAYQVFVEASLRNEKRVLYSAVVEIGGPAGETAVQSQYFGGNAKERNMISDLRVTYTP